MGTVRTVLFVKGKTIEPFLIAFFEVLIWFFIAREALNNNNNAIIIGISYALGYATGTFIGSKLANRFIKEILGVQIIVKEPSKTIINRLRSYGYQVSVIELKECYDGFNKDMLFIELNSSSLKELINIVKSYDKEAFIVANETKVVYNGFVK